MHGLSEVKRHLRPGQVYRRADLKRWSNAVDRHLRQLQAEGTLSKLSGGLYYASKVTEFGRTPPGDEAAVRAFLRDDRFLLSSPNAYNVLGVGATQLYNQTVVYNHKRHGTFTLGGRTFDFRMKPRFPASLSEEFLLVDLLNNLSRVAEDRDRLLGRLRAKAATMDRPKLTRAAREFGGVRARKFVAEAAGATIH